MDFQLKFWLIKKAGSDMGKQEINKFLYALAD